MVITTQDAKLKPGYKLTEVGVIPEDWEVKPLGEIASVSSGGTPDRSNPTYWNGDIPWVTTTQIDFNLIDEANEFITGKGLENSAARIYNPGTLLMAMYGQGKTRGKVALMVMSAAINQACAAIKLNKGISGKYVFFNLSARYEEIRSFSNTGNQENLNATIIKSILLQLPKDEKEQCAIVDALSDVDTLITSLDKLIAKKRDIKQATMQQLLTGKTRLPGFSGEWKVKKLGEIAYINMGQSPDSKNYNVKGIGIPLIQGNADIENRKSISRVWTTQVSKTCNKGDLIMTVRAPLGSIGIATKESCLGRGVCSLKCTSDDSHFIFHSMVFLEDEWKILGQGSTFASANSLQIAEFPMSIPDSIEEQQAIATVLSDMDAEIAALEQKRDKIRALKQGMMQELLTGKTRLL